MKIGWPALVGLGLIVATLACNSSDGQPTPFPTAGITVQVFPHVEITTPTPAGPGQADTPVATDTATFTPLPPTETFTPLPTYTPTLESTPAGLGQAATALIQVKPPTATKKVVVPTQAPVVKTAVPTQAAAGPIAFRAVQFVTAKPDPSRANGSFTTLSVEFAGSRAPFTVKHDNLVGATNPNGDGKFENAGVTYTYIYFTILKSCGGPIVGTVTVTGGDGQTFTKDYYVDKAPCS
jgi:hypothetical protein